MCLPLHKEGLRGAVSDFVAPQDGAEGARGRLLFTLVYRVDCLGYRDPRPLTSADKRHENYYHYLISCSALLECAGKPVLIQSSLPITRTAWLCVYIQPFSDHANSDDVIIR